MKDNRLIAEFMGAFFDDNGMTRICGQYGLERVNDLSLKYHTSWDWLMPVVEKCLEKHNNLIDGRDVIDTSYPSIAQALQVVSLGETYKAVVEFINQLNN